MGALGLLVGVGVFDVEGDSEGAPEGVSEGLADGLGGGVGLSGLAPP